MSKKKPISLASLQQLAALSVLVPEYPEVPGGAVYDEAHPYYECKGCGARGVRNFAKSSRFVKGRSRAIHRCKKCGKER